MTQESRTSRHTPVLSQDVIRYLDVSEGGTYLDCTIGLAGHASQIARLLGPNGHLIGFDRDPKALELAGQRLQALAEKLGDRMPKVTLIGEAFSKAAEHVEPASLDGLLADFGVSSMQIDEPERGFSFQTDGPLDMRQDTRQGVTAAQVVNEMDERDLANLIYEYGEERRSRRIARAIVRARPVTTTGQLARIVAGSAPTMKQERIHPATRTFQALRIHVNRELDEIRQLLEAAPQSCLSPQAQAGWSSSAFTRWKTASRKTCCASSGKGHLDGADTQAGSRRRRRDGSQSQGEKRQAESCRDDPGRES
jgi:16S rRNA (cytosine1402-N4)-methyltransferase